MSTGAAIAATTETIRLELQEFLPDLSGVLGSQPKVSALPPDRIQTGGSEADQLNVFLYRTAPNPGWRNVDLPSRGADGARRSQPPLALDLHYLLSAYAAEDLHADVLLGYAMEVLHGLSVLTAAAIGQRFAGATPPDVPDRLWKQLTASGLDKQVERVTLTMEQQTTDDISKLWSVLGEKYRPSAAYVATVVLIQPEGPAPAAPPVTRPPALLVEPLLGPTVARLEPADLVWAADTVVTLHGSHLLGEDTTVLLGGAAAGPAATSTDQAIQVTLPATTRAGMAPVRVRHAVTFPGGTKTRPFEESDPVLLVVRPRPGVASHVAATDTAPPLLRVPVAPEVGPTQEVVLQLNEVGGTRGYTLPARSRAAAVGTVDFADGTVVPGSYRFRVRVDGAESLLTTGATGAFDGPTVSVP